MKMFFWYLLFICLKFTNANCPHDEDLQHHQCVCSSTNNYIQCSSLPNQCRTCYRYNAIYFDEKVNILPVEAFRFYDFFNNTKKKLFKIQFNRLDNISSNSFSKINIDRERNLDIKILKYSLSVLPTRVFEDITIQSKARLDIEIYNVTSAMLKIEQYALDGIRFDRESQFRLSILHAKDTIQFASNAGSILLPSYSYMELYISNFVRIFFEEHSFDHITQEYSSELIINFDHFQYATLSHNSFFDFHQLEHTRFHLSLSNFENLIIEQTLFDTITQLKSLLIISIYNLTNNFCLPSKTFSQIEQDQNSTIQLEINHGKNILFTSDSFLNINQKLQSKLSIMIVNSFDVYFSRHSLNNFHQEDRSIIDIWIKYGRNLIFEDYAINNIDIDRSSILRIGFQHSRGTLQMAINAFSKINQGQGGELLFQIMNSSDFYFRFNQSISLKTFQILDRSLSSNDFCRITNIPSHIPIKLLYENQCSCTIYYLYRHLHHTLIPSVLNDLTPACYSNMSLDEIEYAENKCLFKTKIYDCQQMEGEIQINIPQKICQKHLILNEKSEKNSAVFIILIIFVGLMISLTCMYILLSNERNFHCYRRQKSPYYQQLTQHESNDRMKKLIIKYNSTTEQTEPYLDDKKSDFVQLNTDEKMTLKLNTNPMSDIEDNNL